MLSDLLWAAFGINRPLEGKRTAPSTMNFQAIDIYVALSSGLYLYDAGAHVLPPVLAEDVRPLTGEQEFVKDVPVNLVYVADMAKMMMGDAPQELRDFYAAADTGFISQNVYLYCASQGLATVVRGMINRPNLAKSMKLRKVQKIILAQSVGYPKKKATPKSKKKDQYK